jgi:hypothetical protein
VSHGEKSLVPDEEAEGSQINLTLMEKSIVSEIVNRREGRLMRKPARNPRDS